MAESEDKRDKLSAAWHKRFEILAIIYEKFWKTTKARGPISRELFRVVSQISVPLFGSINDVVEHSWLKGFGHPIFIELIASLVVAKRVPASDITNAGD